MPKYNHDILYELWINKNLSKNKVILDEIGKFAENEKMHLHSQKGKPGQVSSPGFNYAVLKFIIDYCRPYEWPEGRWEQFLEQRKKYSIWRKYLNLNLRVNIIEGRSKRDSVFYENIQSVSIFDQKNPDYISKNEYLNQDMFSFIAFIIKTVERNNILSVKGWLDQLSSYQWPPGKGDYKQGINVRKHFNYIVNCATDSAGLGSKIFRYGVCNAIAGWGGIKQQVNFDDCEKIFKSINYLNGKAKKDLIDCNKIYSRRIATTSKIYYFSDPLNWTIYDSRVAFTLNQFAYQFKLNRKKIFNKLKNNIIFPIPYSRSIKRKSLFDKQLNDAEYAHWFIRASILLKAIAEYLNKEDIPSPEEVISSKKSWELYHIEMVFFRLGQTKWDMKNLSFN